MSEYWFARRFPVGNPRNGIAPVSREGRLVALGFGVAMLVGGAIGAAVAMAGETVLGVATFAVIAGLAGGAFIAIAVKKSDRNHTVHDYWNGTVSAGGAPKKGMADERSRTRR